VRVDGGNEMRNGKKYQAPLQGKFSQVLDVIVLLILSIGALYIPLFLKMAGSSKVLPEDMPPIEETTWESLGQNATMVEQWEKLDFTPQTAAEIILARFDYSFSIFALLALIVVIISYYTILLRFSEKEYRDVISEKFGKN